MDSAPKISVLIITYNHERFLREAVEGALMQETDFAVEIIIGEDCSTDGTREVAIELRDKHPDRIRLLLHPHNLGASRNLAETLAACRGEYVALLEGDDYWTNPVKLQRQADFLDAHPDYAICYHDVALTGLPIGEDEWRRVQSFQDETYTIDDLLREGNFLPTCSVMFRKWTDEPLPDWFCALAIGDIALHVLNAQCGKIRHFKHEWATYRVHEGGIWSGQSQLQRWRNLIEVYEAILANLDGTYQQLTQRQLDIAWYCLAMAYCVEANGRTSVSASVRDFERDLMRFDSGRGMRRPQRSRLLAEIYAANAFAAHRERDPAQVRADLVNVVLLYPAMFRNLGLLSIASEAVVGVRIAQWLRARFGRQRRAEPPLDLS